MASGMADGLRQAFNQNVTNEQDPQARLDRKARAFKDNKAFVATNTNGNLYNTENDKPVKMEIPQAMGGSNRREIDMDRLEHAEVGKEVNYTGGTGTVVERRGMYLTIYNKDQDVFDKVHAGETYVSGDIISMRGMNKYWDDITMQDKLDLLTNVNIPLLKNFQGRLWNRIPREIQDVIKAGSIKAWIGEPQHGGMEGREPSHRGQNEESKSPQNAIQPAHVTRPYKDKPAKAFGKSDVEQGWYGGISTTQDPMDANDEYEDKRPKQRLAGAQEAADKDKPATVGSPRRRTDPNKPREDIGYNQKAEQNLAGITGEPSKHKDKEEETQKAQQDLTAITGEPNHGEKKDDEIDKGELYLNAGKLFFNGIEVVLKEKPVEPTPRQRANKESSRYGVRYGVTLKEFEEQRTK